MSDNKQGTSSSTPASKDAKGKPMQGGSCGSMSDKGGKKGGSCS